MRARVNELPARVAIPPRYPASRTRGAVTLPSGRVVEPAGALPATSAPRSRIFAFNMSNATINNRQTISFDRCIGPAIIKNLRLRWSGGVDPPRVSLEIGYSTAPVTENTVATTTARPYTRLTELSDPLAFLPDEVGTGLLNTTYTFDDSGAWDLGFLVFLAEWYPVLSMWHGNVAFTASVVGHLHIVENVSPSVLANFL